MWFTYQNLTEAQHAAVQAASGLAALKGHDFSRATEFSEKDGALAPRGIGTPDASPRCLHHPRHRMDSQRCFLHHRRTRPDRRDCGPHRLRQNSTAHQPDDALLRCNRPARFCSTAALTSATRTLPRSASILPSSCKTHSSSPARIAENIRLGNEQITEVSLRQARVRCQCPGLHREPSQPI